MVDGFKGESVGDWPWLIWVKYPLLLLLLDSMHILMVVGKRSFVCAVLEDIIN